MPRLGSWAVNSSAAAEQILHDVLAGADGTWLAVGSHRLANCGQYGCSSGSNISSNIMRFRGNGEVFTKQVYEYGVAGALSLDELRRLLRLEDGTILALGYRGDPANSAPKFLQGHLIKLDPVSAAPLANHGFDNPVKPEWADVPTDAYLVQTAKGQRLIVGGSLEWLGYSGTRDAVVWQLTPTGEVEAFGRHEEGWDQSESVVAPAPNGGVALACRTNSGTSSPGKQQAGDIAGLGDQDVLWLLFDSKLVVQRAVRLGSGHYDTAGGLVALPTGGYLLASSGGAATPSPTLTRIDAVGAVIWSVARGAPHYADYAGELLLGGDGMPILVGSFFNAGYGQDKAAIWRFDLQGNLLTEATLGGSWGSRAFGLDVAPDGNIVAVGTFAPGPSGQALAWRVDAWGQQDCKTSGACWNKLAKLCDDGEPCTSPLKCMADNASCDQKQLTSACSDGDACTAGETCTNGKCSGAVTIKCDDGNPCTSDACDKATGCSATALADGFECASGKVCKAAKCTTP